MVIKEITDDLVDAKIIDKPEIVELDRPPYEPVSGGDAWLIKVLRD